MTTSVIIKARAWGASVKTRLTTEGQESGDWDFPVEIGPHQDHTIHIPPGSTMSFEVSSTEPAAETTVDPEVAEFKAADETAATNEQAGVAPENRTATTRGFGRAKTVIRDDDN